MYFLHSFFGVYTGAETHGPWLSCSAPQCKCSADNREDRGAGSSAHDAVRHTTVQRKVVPHYAMQHCAVEHRTDCSTL